MYYTKSNAPVLNIFEGFPFRVPRLLVPYTLM